MAWRGCVSKALCWGSGDRESGPAGQATLKGIWASDIYHAYLLFSVSGSLLISPFSPFLSFNCCALAGESKQDRRLWFPVFVHAWYHADAESGARVDSEGES